MAGEPRDPRPAASPASRWVVLGILLLAGLALILSAIPVSSTYIQSLLLNLGTGVLLFAALYVVQRHVLDRVQEVGQAAQKSGERLTQDVDLIRRELAATRIRLEEVGPQAQAVLSQEVQEDLAKLRSLDEDVNFATVLDLLKRGLDLNAISQTGLRIPAAGRAWLRWNVGIAAPGADIFIPPTFPMQPKGPGFSEVIGIRIEDYSGDRLAEVIWRPDTPVSGLMAQIGKRLQSVGRYPGHEGFDPTGILERLQKDLANVLDFRTTATALEFELGPVIELVNDEWIISDYGVHCLKRTYMVAKEQLGANWPAHINTKRWANIEKFEEAYFQAKAFFEGEYLVSDREL